MSGEASRWSARKHLIIGGTALLILVGGFGYWAATAKIIARTASRRARASGSMVSKTARTGAGVHASAAGHVLQQR